MVHVSRTLDCSHWGIFIILPLLTWCWLCGRLSRCFFGCSWRIQRRTLRCVCWRSPWSVWCSERRRRRSTRSGKRLSWVFPLRAKPPGGLSADTVDMLGRSTETVLAYTHWRLSSSLWTVSSADSWFMSTAWNCPKTRRPPSWNFKRVWPSRHKLVFSFPKCLQRRTKRCNPALLLRTHLDLQPNTPNQKPVDLLRTFMTFIRLLSTTWLEVIEAVCTPAWTRCWCLDETEVTCLFIHDSYTESGVYSTSLCTFHKPDI